MHRLLLCACLLLPLVPQRVVAGGLALSGHGVRAMGRAGAVTAGGDDPGAIWQNPACIGGLEGFQVLLDGAIIFHATEYTRVDSGGNPLPTVSNEGAIVPVPTLAVSSRLWGTKRFWIGGSFSAPYAAGFAYPRPSYGPCDPANPVHCIDTAHNDAPQRYSLIAQENSKFLQLDLAIAFQVLPGLIVAASLQNMFIQYLSLNAITSYNGTLSSGPEDPDFDSLAQTNLVTLFNPSGKVGITYQPHPMLRLGVSLQLPFWVKGDAQINVQLPASPLYEKATVEGTTAEVSFTLPMVLRFGGELRPIPELRLELGVDWDQWSSFQEIRVVPQDIYILNIPSIDRYKVPNLNIPGVMGDTVALRLGGEYFFSRVPLVLRAGYIFEFGASKSPHISIINMDFNKHVLTLGAGYRLWGYRLDLMVARSISGTERIDYRQSQARQVNPINPEGAVGVGGGTYHGDYTMLGLGVHKAF